jgi:hypothetical protein
MMTKTMAVKNAMSKGMSPVPPDSIVRARHLYRKGKWQVEMPHVCLPVFIAKAVPERRLTGRLSRTGQIEGQGREANARNLGVLHQEDVKPR